MADYEIDIDDFTESLKEFATRSSYETVEKIHDGIDKITKGTLKEVKEKSPVSEGTDKKLVKGKYKKGWTISVLERRGTYRKVISNKQYQLVHLLELGHDLLDSDGNKYGEVPAYEHVKTAEEYAEEKVDTLIRGL